jgi:hypothetical protein
MWSNQDGRQFLQVQHLFFFIKKLPTCFGLLMYLCVESYWFICGACDDTCNAWILIF